MKKRIVLFYSSVASKRQFSTQRFYRTDICILRDLGYAVTLSNSWLDFLAFWRYDIAFIYFYRFGFMPALLSRLVGKLVFFTGGIDYLDRSYAGFKSYLIQVVFFNLCGIFSHKNIIVSDSDFVNCSRITFLFSRSKNIISKHCIDVENFACPDVSARSKSMVTIVWMARIENVVRKGVLESVELFKRIYERDSEFRFFIIGPVGDGTPAVLDKIQQLGLEGAVIVTGEMSEEEKISSLKVATCYAQLSKYEGFGIAAIEALAAGNIIIHSNQGGLWEAVGQHGIVWKPGDFSCVDEMFQRRQDAANYQAQVIEGLNYVERHYSYRTRLDSFRTIFSGFQVKDKTH